MCCTNHLSPNGSEDLKWSDLLCCGTHKRATAPQTHQRSFLLSKEMCSSQAALTLTTRASGSWSAWACGAEASLSRVIYTFCSSRYCPQLETETDVMGWCSRTNLFLSTLRQMTEVTIIRCSALVRISSRQKMFQGFCLLFKSKRNRD